MNFHRSVAALTKFLHLHKFYGNDGHSPSTVFWKHGALGRCSGNVNALGLQFPLRDLATGKEPQLQPHHLLKHTQMLRRPHELQPNLDFKQTQLREAIAVLTKKHSDWTRMDQFKFQTWRFASLWFRGSPAVLLMFEHHFEIRVRAQLDIRRSRGVGGGT